MKNMNNNPNFTITLHPYFTFTFLLPVGSNVDSSVEMAVLKNENNMLLPRPKSDFDIAKESATRALITINKLNNGVEMELENRDKKLKYSEIMLIDEIYLSMTNPFSKFSFNENKTNIKNKESEEK